MIVSAYVSDNVNSGQNFYFQLLSRYFFFFLKLFFCAPYISDANIGMHSCRWMADEKKIIISEVYEFVEAN